MILQKEERCPWVLQKMKKIKITQIKSPIGREKSQKLTLISLGLNKLNKEKIVTENPAMNGMIEKVKHLLKVEKA